MFRKFALTLTLVALLALSFAFASPVKAAPKVPANTIVGVALAVNADSGEFSTLIAALQAAGLVDALNGKGQFTVFAPTDAAFAKLGLNASNIGSLPRETLTDILFYHVARGSRYSGDVVSSSQMRMLNGSFTKISLNENGAFINSSKIIAVDVPASNGVIHVIDTVLLP